MTFYDTKKCSYDIKIEQDWKNTVKLALLEWISILPGLIFCCFCFFVYATSKIENSFLIFNLTVITTAVGSPLIFKNLPYLIFFISFTTAFLIYKISSLVNRFLSKKIYTRRQPLFIWDIFFITVCLLLSLFLHPFIGALMAALITSLQNRSLPSKSSALKLYYIIHILNSWYYLLY